MRVLRFEVSGQIMFGVCEENSDKVVAIKGDPLFSPVEPSGPIYSLEEVKLLSPVIPRSKVLCARENQTSEVSFYIKPNTSVIGPDDPILLPAHLSELAVSVEVGAVLKTMCRDLRPQDVDSSVFGWLILLNVHAPFGRHLPGSMNEMGFDTSCPIGPWVTVKPDLEFADLSVALRVDDEVEKTASTADLIRSPQESVALASHSCTLLPGDIVTSGNLIEADGIVPGQVLKVDLAGLGTLRNPVMKR
ncbi:fumarylacetoacetate hydrolase family protein [Actinomycetaceae bacterium TAE3-ERU4]|nr:fumarylacetoacetate hydrolase family protein [Actinomycetaceae bacterium TAE3-ERU4]